MCYLVLNVNEYKRTTLIRIIFYEPNGKKKKLSTYSYPTPLKNLWRLILYCSDENDFLGSSMKKILISSTVVLYYISKLHVK